MTRKTTSRFSASRTEDGMGSDKEPYIGIVIFELEKQGVEGDTGESFYREDFYIVYANSENEARQLVEARARSQVSPENSARSDRTDEAKVSICRIVDVAPALYGYVDRDCDLYSRHFASLEDYKRFEMMLDGTDPLTH